MMGALELQAAVGARASMPAAKAANGKGQVKREPSSQPTVKAKDGEADETKGAGKAKGKAVAAKSGAKKKAAGKGGAGKKAAGGDIRSMFGGGK